MTGLRTRLDESRKAFRAVFHNPELRKVQLAHIGSITGEWGYVVALLVYAEGHGGPKAVSLVLVLRWVSAALTSSWLAVLADRVRRERLMLAADLTRASIMGIMAIAAFSGWSAVIIYAGATLVSIASRAFYPAQQALLPSLARTPEELTAANVASSGIESVGAFAGPALGGLLLAATNTGTVFVATALTFVWSAFLVSRLHSSERPEPVAAEESPGMLSEAVEGFRVLAKEPAARLIVGLYSVQTLVDGAMKVLLVVTALDLLDIGKSGLGFLNAAIGVGGLIGVGLTFALVGRNRLANDFGTGLLLMGARARPDRRLPEDRRSDRPPGGARDRQHDRRRLSRHVDAARRPGRGAGARVRRAREPADRDRCARGAPGSAVDRRRRHPYVARHRRRLLVVVTVALWAKLRAIDLRVHVPEAVLDLLRANPIFGPLPPPTVEHLAARLVPRTEEAGATIFRQGDHGDLFYLVDRGSARSRSTARKSRPPAPATASARSRCCTTSRVRRRSGRRGHEAPVSGTGRLHRRSHRPCAEP